MPNPNMLRSRAPAPVLPPMGRLGNFFADNQALLLALGGGLLAHRQNAANPIFDTQGVMGATAYDREGRESRQTKNMTKDWLMRAKGLSEQDAEVAVANPTIMSQLLAGNTPEYTSVAEGSSLFNEQTGEWMQPPPRAGGGQRYQGNSVEAQALNHLIDSGMPPEQADQLAAGKIVTDPSTGALIFMTPQGIFSQADPQSPPQPITPNAQSSEQQPSAMPGIQLTPGKPNKAKSQDQVKGEILVASAERDFQVANQLFDALGNRADLAKGYGGRIGEYFQSPDYQVATDAVRNVIQSYIYAVSGAQAPEQEVVRNMQLVVPNVVDSPERVEAKRQRLAAMMEAIRVKARENTDDGLGGLGVESLYQKYGLEP